MNTTRLARRYAPLAALAVVQLLIIMMVPSRTPDVNSAALSAGDAATGEVGADGQLGVEGIVTGDGTGAGGGAAGPGGVAGAGGRTAGGAAAAAGAAGDTSHCVKGRQYDPDKYWYYAPTCKPKWAGGNNGGATYTGVTPTTVKVIKYEGKPNPAVDAILAALGSDPTEEDLEQLKVAAQKFINDKYELYGRKVEIKRVQGQCTTVPPDYPCLRGEMRDLVASEKPFAVMWLTTVASAAFDELSAQKVINLGGYHFRDSFNQQRRPYHYDFFMGGSQVAKHVAEWYCKRMYGNGQYKAKFAGQTGTGAGQNATDLRGRTRVLGVISTDDPENKNTVTELKAYLSKECGAKVQHEFYYAQDISRAEEQRRLGVAKMRESPESTTIMCFCDAVAPVFLYRTCEEQKYYPEHVVVGTSLMDQDVVAQAYDGTLNPGGHQFENALGLGSVPKERKLDDSTAAMLKRYAGQNPDLPDRHGQAPLEAAYYLIIANMIQAAGPNLNPLTVERGMWAEGPRGGTAEILDPFLNLNMFRQGDYTWSDDMREIYFSKAKVSHYNGKPGTWVDLNGNKRFKLGEYPSGEPPIPEKPR